VSAPGGGAAAPVLPGSLGANRRLGQWLRFTPRGEVEVYPGKVELGQGILTALADIVAFQLDIRIERVRMMAASTATSPDEGMTSGSMSIQHSGAALRQASAEARAILLASAAARLGCGIGALAVEDGEILGMDGARTSYWELDSPGLLNVEATGAIEPRTMPGFRNDIASTQRIDLPDKVFGRPRFIHDLELPGMLHGRMLRPPSQAATLAAIDDDGLRLPEGTALVREGSLVGVIAPSARACGEALEYVRQACRWEIPADALPDEANLPAWLKRQQAETTAVEGGTKGSSAAVARTLRAAFSKPYIAHASIGLSCAIARFDTGRLEVWCHSQGIFNLRRDLAVALRLAEHDIVVNHVEGAGCYGHNPADDVAFDAAFLAMATPGRPVGVIWSRADELTWSAFGPAMAFAIEADLDAAGNILDWRHEFWSNGHTLRPGRDHLPALLGHWHRDPAAPRPQPVNPPLATGGGADRNAVPTYAFPHWRVTNNKVLAMPLRTSALRSLGAFGNVFAAECFMDEIAHAIGDDPVAFRLRHSTDPRAHAVIALAAEKAGWNEAVSGDGHGWGIGFARYKNSGAYCAVVAKIVAEAAIRVERLTIAVDVGQVVNRDGVVNQVEGGAIQATSWTLQEAVRFDRQSVTSDSWETYPILPFSEVPAVDVHIVASANPPVGAGECAMGPTAAAIGNAVFRALGVRVRDLPLTPARIVAASVEGDAGLKESEGRE
jgi:CO/xanthine dehydrogenase Mo-binding subunit